MRLCPPPVLAVLALSLTLTGCQFSESVIREQFAQQHSCPDAQIEVRERSDLDAGALALAKRSRSQPSAEVTADPARLAVWTAEEARQRESYRRFHARLDVLEVRGCGQQAIVGCQRGQNLLQVSCREL